MPRVTIDGRPVEVPEGTTIREAARRAGVEIPTLCCLDGVEPDPSCMVCSVKLDGAARAIPSCSTRIRDGMAVDTSSTAVTAYRRSAMELLLSEHVGNCLAPCQRACPAEMDIPRVLHAIGEGKLKEALSIARERIALPAALGRVCSAPCEKACWRGLADAPLAVCLLKRYAADTASYVPGVGPRTGKSAAVIGAGPAGLSAAFYLLEAGHEVTVYDDHAEPGGRLRDEAYAAALPREVLDGEIAIISHMGMAFVGGTAVGDSPSLDELRERHDAVVIATGRGAPANLGRTALEKSADGIRVEPGTWRTALPKVFAAGSAVRPVREPVYSVGQGREAAEAANQLLAGEPVTGPRRRFDSKTDRARRETIRERIERSGTGGRAPPRDGAGDGLTPAEAVEESRRCLNCGCRSGSSCTLRRYAELYDAKPGRFPGRKRAAAEPVLRPAGVLYDAGKCIACGLCVKIVAAGGRRPALTFVGRGFDVRVAGALGRSVDEALGELGAACVEACPTGALRAAEDGETAAARG